jgi:hypothetical protein
MSTSKRFALFILALIIVFFLVLVFWPFILNSIIIPISTVVWIVLRIYVLSIDQKYYWGAFILGIMVLVLWQFFQEEPNPEPDKIKEENIIFTDIEFWQNKFLNLSNNQIDRQLIKKELIHLLTAMYTAEQQDKSQYMILDAIIEKEIPLPETIYDFLFSEELKGKQRSIIKTLKKIWQTPVNWIKLKGIRETQMMETQRMIIEILSLIEISLEIKHDNQ